MASKILHCRRCNKTYIRGEGGSTLDYCKTGELQDCCSDSCAFHESYGMMPEKERRQYNRPVYVGGKLVPVIV